MGKLHKIRKAIEKEPSKYGHTNYVYGIRCERFDSGWYIAPSYWKPSYRAFAKHVLSEINNSSEIGNADVGQGGDAKE